MITNMLTPRIPVLFLVAFAMRLILFHIPTVANTLAGRVEVVTPITSFKRLTEGIYLFESGVPPYDGSTFHQAPLLLALFKSIPRSVIPTFYILADLLLAYFLMDIAFIKQKIYSKKERMPHEKEWKPISPELIGAFYLFSPLSLASLLSKSTILFTNLSVVISIRQAARGRLTTAMFWISTATYLSLYPAMLMPPICLVLAEWTDGTKRNWGVKSVAIKSSLIYIFWITMLLMLSFLLVGSWDFIPATYGVTLLVADLTPNIGLFWYFFIEIFDQFRPFFLVVFQLHIFIFTAPLCIKLRSHPLFVIFILCGIMSVFKPYPSIGDTVLHLAFLPIHDEIFPYMRYGFLITNLYLYSAALAPAFWHLWIYAGSGNANFFFAITLVYNVGQILCLIDGTYALLRREFDIYWPEHRGKEVVQK